MPKAEGRYKICCVCKKNKHVAKYHKSAKASDGLQHACISCSANSTRAWQKTNLTHYLAYRAKQYKEKKK